MNREIVERLIFFIFKDLYDENGGGVENRRNLWIVRLSMVSHLWFDVVTSKFTKFVIHNNTSLQTADQITRALQGVSNPLSLFRDQLTEVRFESMDRDRRIDAQADLFATKIDTITSAILNGTKNGLNITSLLFIDSDIVLKRLINNQNKKEEVEQEPNQEQIEGEVKRVENKNLENLVLSSSHEYECRLDHLSILMNQCKSLKSLYLYMENQAVHHEMLSNTLKNHPSLLDIQVNPAEPHDWLPELLQSLLANPNMTRLQLSGFDVRVQDMIELLERNKNLQSLNTPINFGSIQSITQLNTFTTLLSQTHLTELFIYPTPQEIDTSIISIEDFKNSIANIFNNEINNNNNITKSLHLLSIESFKEFTSPSLLINIGRWCSALSTLKISDKSIDNTYITSLAEMIRTTQSLYMLSIPDNLLNSVEDKQVEIEFSEAFKSNKSIKEVDIGGNKFIGEHIIKVWSESDQLLSLTLNSTDFTSEAKQMLASYVNETSNCLHAFQDLKSRQIDFFSMLQNMK